MPQLLVVNWFFLAAPAGTPQVVIDRLNAETVKIMQTGESRQHFAHLGGEVISTTPDQALVFVREEYARWGKVIREANIKAD
jgi:tripartite-type tricarboxylate transporter receptor subunit TctC